MSLNIGGGEDEFFRYKMPDIEVKIEGRGNGIKTVIPNMADVAQALKRDPGYPTKFFATELGALSKWDEKRNVGIVNGAHDKSTLKRLLAEFIERYVLCPQCKLPETDLKIKKGMIYSNCKACGHYALSDNQHKLATYILNHPPGGKKDGKKDKKAKKDGKKDKKEKRKEKRQQSEGAEEEEEESASQAQEGDDGEEGEEEVANGGEGEEDNGDDAGGESDSKKSDGAEEKEKEEKKQKKEKKAKAKEQEQEGMHFELSEEMLKVKVSSSSAAISDPLALMEEAIDNAKNEQQRLANIAKLQKEHKFTDEEVFQYMIKSTITNSLAKQVKANVGLIKKLIEDGRQGQVRLLALIEERCEADPANLRGVSAALMVLYDKDVLEEEAILDWHEKGTSQIFALADHQACQETRKAATKMVEWLKSAEEEESDEDEE